MSDKDFDSVFKDRLGDLSSTPSELNWVGIESQLPKRKARGAFFWWVPVAAVLVSLGIWGGAKWMTSSSSPALQSISTWDSQLQFSPNTVAQLLAANALNKPVNTRKNSSTKPTTTEMTATTGSSSGTLQAPAPPAIVQPAYADLSRLSSLSVDRLSTDQVMVVNPVFYDEEEQLKRYAVSGFRVGPIVQAQLGQHAGGSLPVDHASLGMQPGMAYGMAFHYDFSPRWGIEVDALISSAEGTRVRFDHAAQSPVMEQDVFSATTNYVRIPVLVKYRQPVASRTNTLPSIWNYQVGLQYGRMNWVNLDGSADLFMPNQFNTHELGYVAGISRDWYLGRNYLFSLGARGSVSHALSSTTTPSALTWQLGIHAQLNLLLPQKH